MQTYSSGVSSLYDQFLLLWQNPTPSFSRFCRPIRFRFVEENTDVAEEDINFIKNSAISLIPTEIILNGNKFSFPISHLFILRMLDAKVCNAATGRCYICTTTSKDFNKINIRTRFQVYAPESDFLNACSIQLTDFQLRNIESGRLRLR